MGRRGVAGMLKLVHSVVSVLARRFRRRAVLEVDNLALRHQLHVLRRQQPGEVRRAGGIGGAPAVEVAGG
jgi:hypothetical protein